MICAIIPIHAHMLKLQKLCEEKSTDLPDIDGTTVPDIDGTKKFEYYSTEAADDTNTSYCLVSKLSIFHHCRIYLRLYCHDSEPVGDTNPHRTNKGCCSKKTRFVNIIQSFIAFQ